MLRYAAIVVTSLVVIFSHATVHAQSTDIRATICAAGSVSDITLRAEPQGGTTLRISGSVVQSPYIDIFIDGRKHDRIYFAGTDTEYFTTAPITPGSHLIQAFIYDACTDSMLVSEVTVTIPGVRVEDQKQVHLQQSLMTSLGSLSLLDSPRVFYDDRSSSYQKIAIDQVIMNPFPWWLFFALSSVLLIVFTVYLLYRWRGALHVRHLKGRAWMRARTIGYLLLLAWLCLSIAFFLQAL